MKRKKSLLAEALLVVAHLQLAAQEANGAQRFATPSSQPSVPRCEDLPPMSEEATRAVLEKLRFVESALENRSRDAALYHLNGFFPPCGAKGLPFPACIRCRFCCIISVSACS